MKIQLDKDSLQKLGIEHGEKVFFGFVILLVLVIGYLTIAGVTRYGRTPANLQERITFAESDVNKTKADSLSQTITEYSALAERNRTEISEDPYTTKYFLFDPPLFDKPSLRDAPPLFAVEKLRGAGDIGAFKLAFVKKSASANSAEERGKTSKAGSEPGVRGQAWITLVGLVPETKQKEKYRDTFRPALGYDAARDVPKYAGYKVERVEVANAEEAAKPDWTKAKKFFSTYAIKEAKDSWGNAAMTEVVDKAYLDATQALAFPLGPLVGRSWGVFAAHEPEVPLLRKTAIKMKKPDDERAPDTSRKPEDSIKPSDGSASGEEEDPFNNKKSVESKPDPEVVATKPKKAEDEPKVIKNKLFRFLDFDVEPGKSYVYRVCLVLNNPNAESAVKTTYLKPELAVVAKDLWVFTKWSDASPVITVPYDTRLLVRSVKPAPKSVESTANIVLAKWLLDEGVEVYEEFPQLYRGQLADYKEHNYRTSHLTPGSPKESRCDFISKATLIDFRGGGLINKRDKNSLTDPGEVLFMDRMGNLVVHSEIDDSLAYDELTGTKEEGSTPSANPRKPPSGSLLDQPGDDRRKPPRGRTPPPSGRGNTPPGRGNPH